MSKKEEKKFKKLEKQYNDENNELKRLGKVILIVAVSFGILYFLGGLVTGKIKLWETKKEQTEIQYTEILAEQTFKQDNETYFVLYFDSEDNAATLLNIIKSNLSSNGTVFTVDLNKEINSGFIADSEKSINKTPKNASQLKVVNPTLIKISNDKVKDFIVGLDKIKEYSLK